MELNKKIAFSSILFISLLFVLLASSSYAYFKVTLSGKKINYLRGGILSVKLDDKTSSGISLVGQKPIQDEDGLNYTPYTFTITNDGEIDSSFQIYLDDMGLDTGEERVNDKFIKYGIKKNDEAYNINLLSNSGLNPNRVIFSDTIPKNSTYRFSLLLWVDYEATSDAMGKVFKGKIRVEAGQDKTSVTYK